MRDIKFRAWDKRVKKMLQGVDFEITFVGDTFGVYWKNVCLGGNMQSSKDLDGFILMQYIGRKDKNSVEIYEGDIIKRFGGKQPFLIVFDKFGRFVMQVYGEVHATCDFTNISDEDIEVIGNIYEDKQ